MFQSAAGVVGTLAALVAGTAFCGGLSWAGTGTEDRAQGGWQSVGRQFPRDGSSTAADEKTVARRCRHCTELKVLANPKVHPVKEKLSVALNGREVQTEMLLIS
jgi:hypothetical protein